MEAVAARGIQVLAALGGAYLVALWFVLIVWTFRDVETRSKNVITQICSTLMVVLFFVPGVLLYLILRPKETLDAAFQRSLEEEYLLQDLEELPLCRSCQHYVEDDFMICPNCQTHLRDACHVCARLVDLRWTVCPYCGSEQSRTGDEEETKVPEVAARWSAPVALRRRILRQLPAGSPDGGTVREVETQPAAIAFSSLQSSAAPPPPVRLFDRRKTREASRLNGYRRPTMINGNGSSANGGGALVDQFGRSLDATHGEIDANDRDSLITVEREASVRVSVTTKETGD
jgi:RNA polymerase subunit RPABC4/transcription elongation factor Spt4